MPDPLPIQSVHHISHITSHLDDSIAFYRDVMGFRSIKRPDFDFRGAWLFNYGVQIHLIETDQPNSDQTEIETRADHIAFYVPDTEQVEQLLKDRDISFRANFVAKTGVKQLFFHDPDGNHIEVGTYPAVQELTENG